MLSKRNVNSKKSVVFGIAYMLLATVYSGGGWLMPKPENRAGETKTRSFFRRWGKKLPIVGGVFVLSYYIGIYIKKPANLVLNHILKPIGRGIKAVYTKVLEPAYNFAKQWTIKIAGYVSKSINFVSLWAYEKVLKPIGSGVKAAYAKILKPAYNFVKQCVVKIAEYIGKGIKSVSLWTYEKILKPIGNGISIAAEVLGRGIKFVGLWTYEKILKPIGNGISTAAEALGRGIKSVGLWTYEKILTPIGNGIKAVYVFSYTKVLEPAYNFTKQCIVKVSESVKNGISWVVGGYNSANAAYDNAGKKVEWYQNSNREIDIKKATWYMVKTTFTAGGTLIFHAPTKLENNKHYLNDHENRKESKFREVCRNIANHVPLGSIFASVLYVPVLVNGKLYDYGWNSVKTQNSLTRGREFRIVVHNKFIDFLNFSSEKKWKFKCWRREQAIEFKKWSRGLVQDFREWRSGTTQEREIEKDNKNSTAEQSDNIPQPRAHKELYTRQDAMINIAKNLLAMLKDAHNAQENKLTRRKHLVNSNQNLRKNRIIFNAIGDDGKIQAVTSNPTINNDKVDQLYFTKNRELLTIMQDMVKDESSYKNAKKVFKDISTGQLEVTSVENIVKVVRGL